jgi:hypothetical protein
MLPALAEEIERLAERAIPRSRAKQPYAALAGPSLSLGEGCYPSPDLPPLKIGS